MRHKLVLQRVVVWLFSISVPLVLSALPVRISAQTPAHQTTVVAGQDVAPKIDEYMSALVKAGWFNGSILIAREGKVIVNKGYGMANFELDVPNTPQTKFRLGSITKPFTAMAIMLLQERGKLSLQDSICKYFTDCPAGWQAITIHHLLSHTSGLAKHDKAGDYLKIAMMPMPLPQLIDSFKNKPADFKPGEKFDYNNNGYILLGYVIEKISGQSYEEFLKENIFAPLKMADTGYDNHDPIIKNRAAGYRKEDSKLLNAWYTDPSQPFSAGSLYSTTGDLMLLDQALYDGKLLSSKTMDLLFTPGPGNYGYGWFVMKQNNRRAIMHPGGVPGFSAMITRFPESKVLIVVLSNMDNMPVLRASNDLGAIVFSEKYELPRTRTAIKVDPKILDAYVGDYEDRPGRVTGILVHNGTLMLKLGGVPDLIEMAAESETEFFDPYHDTQVVFVKDAGGRVTEMILRINGREFHAKKVK